MTIQASSSETPFSHHLLQEEVQHSCDNVHVSYQTPIEDETDLQTRLLKLNTKAYVITWFIGHQGLGENWMNYLSDQLLEPMRKTGQLAKFYFYDLFAWQYLNKLDDKYLQTVPRPVQEIKQRNIADVKVIRSNQFLDFLNNETDRETVDYVNDVVWRRDFIEQKSLEWEERNKDKPAGPLLKEALPNSQLIKGIENAQYQDTYSTIQYLEMAYLINHIATRALLKNGVSKDSVDIVFLLPNDEYNYCIDEKGSFPIDVKNIFFRDTSKQIRIHFMPFIWGKEMHHRPYLSAGRSVRGGKLKKAIEKLQNY